MTWTRDMRIALVTYHPDGVNPAVKLKGISEAGIDANATTRREVFAGSIFGQTVALESLSPTGRFSALDIEDAVAALGLNGACITSTVNPGLIFDFTKQDCKTVALGNVHSRYTIGTGIVAPQTLSVDHRGNVVLTYQIWAAYDGTNKPVVIAHDVAAPTIPTPTEKTFTMARAEIDTGAPVIDGKRNVSLEFNPTIVSEGADSDIFDSVQSIASMLQSVTVRGIDPHWIEGPGTAVVDDITTGKTLVGANELTIFLKDRAQAIGAAAHIKLSLKGMINPESIVSGRPDAPAETSFKMDLIEDGVNAPITALTGQVIPS